MLIKTASLDDLKEIRSQWIAGGDNYGPEDWYAFWRSFTDRELVLNGHNLNDPDF